MIAPICQLLALLATPFRSKLSLEAENAALRQQIILLRQKLRGRIGPANADRVFFAWLDRLVPSVLGAVPIIRPATLIRRHRAGFHRDRRWESRLRRGRPPVPRARP